MAKALSPMAAKVSYVVNRGVRPAINVVCLASGAFGLYALTRPPVDCSAQPARLVHLQEDGTLVVVESTEHPSVEARAKLRAQEIGRAFGQFARGESGPVRARLDRIYTGTHPDLRGEFRGESERLVALVERTSSRILEEKLDMKFLEDKNAWQVIFRARLLEEDENGRQSLKHMALGMHFAVVSPTANSPEILYLSTLKVNRQDAPDGPQQGVGK
jgi:hypothetical protein